VDHLVLQDKVDAEATVVAVAAVNHQAEVLMMITKAAVTRMMKMTIST
jgi:hypothetical protein